MGEIKTVCKFTMASSTNPRVRRFNQMIRVGNQEQIPKDVYFGKPTITSGFGAAINTYHPIMQNETTKTLLEWNYNQYHDRYAHLYPEDNSGLNNYKIGQQNISHNYDKVDKTFKEKKLQSTIKKNILVQDNKPHSWMRKQVHGDPNSYSSFKDIFEHRYLYNVNNPWPEGEVGYGPFNRPSSNRNGMNRSMYAGANPFPSLRKKSGNMMENGDGTENAPVNDRAESVDNVYNRNNPVHTDEQFLPSYGINHQNVKLQENKQDQNMYKFEKVNNEHGKQAHLDEDFMPSYDKNYMGSMKTRKFAATPMKGMRRNYTYNVSKGNGTNSLSCDMNHGRRGEIKAPTSYMFRESQRMAAQKDSHRQAINNRNGQAINPNTNFRPDTTGYVDPLRTVDPVRIKDRELAHALHDMNPDAMA